MLSHAPVLLNEILGHLLLSNTKMVLDGTLGLGGHAAGILSKFNSIEKYIGCDLDVQHLSFAEKKLSEWRTKLVLKNKNFSSIKDIVEEVGIDRPFVILLDLGLCSNQVDDPQKGFSFASDGPLCMSFEGDEKKCEHLINNVTEAELTKIFREFGEEPAAHKISKIIIEARTHQPITTTGQLKSIILAHIHPKNTKKTLSRIFQALRISINDELFHLEKVLDDGFSVMQPGDRIGIISYHSLEDRMVKKFFKEKTTPLTEVTVLSLHSEITPAQAKLLTKKAITPTMEEIAHNSRSRSAKLRIIQKV